MPICQVALSASQQEKDEPLLDEVVTINGWRKRVAQLAQDIGLTSQRARVPALHMLTSVSQCPV